MKLFTTTLILAFGMSAMALDWDGRFEIRDNASATSVCGNPANTSCSAAGALIGFGAGLTSEVYSFSQNWGIYSGGLLRQRIAGGNTSGTNFNVTYLDFDIPVELLWHFAENWNARLGANVALRLQSAYGGVANANINDQNSFLAPEVGVDYKFGFNKLAYLQYESAATEGYNAAATAITGQTIATSYIVSIGYGWRF